MKPFGDPAGGFIIPKKPKFGDTKFGGINGRKSSELAPSSSTSSSALTSSSRQRIHGIGFPVWTGSLHFGDEHVESIDLMSPHRNSVKPSGFSSSLKVHRLTYWKDILKYEPISQLTSKSSSVTLLQKQSLMICMAAKEGNTSNKNASHQYLNISYFYLLNTFSPLFERLCKTMKENKQAAFGVYDGGTIIILIPEGNLANQLGLPIYEGSGTFMHCLSLVSANELLDSNAKFYTFDTIPNAPTSADKVDGADPKIIAKIEQYHRNCNLPIVKKVAPKQLDTLLSPNHPPPGGKPPTPYIPTPGYPQPPNRNRIAPSASLASSSTYKTSQQTQPPPTYHQQQYNQRPRQSQQLSTSSTSTYSTAASKQREIDDPLHSLIYGPPPPPPKQETPIFPPRESIVEKQQMNKAMFANAFEAIKNIKIGQPTVDKTNVSNALSSCSPMDEPQSPQVTNSTSDLTLQQQDTSTKDGKNIPLKELSAPVDPRLARDPRRMNMGMGRFNNNTVFQYPLAQKTTPTPVNGNGRGVDNYNTIPPLPKTAYTKNQKEGDGTQEEILQGMQMQQSQTEVLHEIAPMDIDESDSQPYSPSQVNISPSPEPMELVDKDNNNDEEQQYDGINTTKTSSHVVDEEKKATENCEAKRNNDDKGGEISMDISTNQNLEVVDSINASRTDGTSYEINKKTTGFTFDYLDIDWHTPEKLKNVGGAVGCTNSKGPNLKNADLLDKDIKSMTNTEMEHQGQQQQEDDKDFRQLWQSTSSSTDSSLGIPKTNKSVNHKAALPSLMHLNVSPPPQLQKSPPSSFDTIIHPLIPQHEQSTQKGGPATQAIHSLFSIKTTPVQHHQLAQSQKDNEEEERTHE